MNNLIWETSKGQPSDGSHKRPDWANMNKQNYAQLANLRLLKTGES